MSEEVTLSMNLTLREATVIKFLRSTHSYGKITVTKIDGKIERILNEEMHTVKQLSEEYGLISEVGAKPLDKPTDNVIVE